MVAVGAVLLVPGFQARLALAGAPLTNWSDRHFGGPQKSSLVGQMSVGLLLGAVWSPCVGVEANRITDRRRKQPNGSTSIEAEGSNRSL